MSPVRIYGDQGYSELKAPTQAVNTSLILPSGTGTSGQYLQTSGASGALSWAAAGKILQVVSTTKTDTTSGTNKASDNSWASALSATITPSLSTSKILVIGFVSFGTDSDSAGGDIAAVMRLVRDSTAICVGDAASNRRRATLGPAWSGRNDMVMGFPFNYLDNPTTTSATTYSIQMAIRGASGGTWYVNRSLSDGDNTETSRQASTITVMEVAA